MPHESDTPAFIETDVWETRPGGSRRWVRTKTIAEVFDEIRAAVGDAPAGAEEYLSIPPWVEADRPWPDGRIVAFAVTGASEGHYVHVEVLSDRPSQ